MLDQKWFDGHFQKQTVNLQTLQLLSYLPFGSKNLRLHQRRGQDLQLIAIMGILGYFDRVHGDDFGWQLCASIATGVGGDSWTDAACLFTK